MAEIEVRTSGERVDAAVGDRLAVTLTENATTGFRWVVGELPEPLEQIEDVFLPPSASRPGAAGERRIVLAARAPGEGRVELRLERPWEDEAADRFELVVTVR